MRLAVALDADPAVRADPAGLASADPDVDPAVNARPASGHRALDRRARAGVHMGPGHPDRVRPVAGPVGPAASVLGRGRSVRSLLDPAPVGRGRSTNRTIRIEITTCRTVPAASRLAEARKGTAPKGLARHSIGRSIGAARRSTEAAGQTTARGHDPARHAPASRHVATDRVRRSAEMTGVGRVARPIGGTHPRPGEDPGETGRARGSEVNRGTGRDPRARFPRPTC